MATVVSLIADVTDYLVAQCNSNPALGAANPPVTVFDGPATSGTQMEHGQRIWIGHDPMISGPGVAADETQDFAFLDSAQTRDERGRIVCAAEDWSGDRTMQVHRDAVKGIVGAVEKLLRGYPGAGNSPGDATMGGLVTWSGVTSARSYPRQGQDGAGWMCVFEISFYARLTS